MGGRVNRVDYRDRWGRDLRDAIGERVFRLIPLPLLATIIATTLLLSIVYAIEGHRCTLIESDAAATAQLLTRTAAIADRNARLDADIANLRRTANIVERARRATLEQTNDIVRIGNALPGGITLSALRADAEGRWSIEGRAVQLADVGAAMQVLATVDPRSSIRLTAVGARDRRSTVPFAVAWERSP